ncbi:MAG: PilZ domain-containing protein [Alphaproteobacteria bacterium]|nr:PilZ domain-containing protein [Alphaproteobacteria bacterium]
MAKTQPRWDGCERRLGPRVACDGPSSVILADNVHVFCRTLDVTQGGASVLLPGNYRMRIGERFTLAARCIGSDPVEAVVVHQSNDAMGCVFAR